MISDDEQNIYYNGRIILIFDRRLCRYAAEMPAKCQDDTTTEYMINSVRNLMTFSHESRVSFVNTAPDGMLALFA